MAETITTQPKQPTNSPTPKQKHTSVGDETNHPIPRETTPSTTKTTNLEATPPTAEPQCKGMGPSESQLKLEKTEAAVKLINTKWEDENPDTQNGGRLKPLEKASHLRGN